MKYLESGVAQSVYKLRWTIWGSYLGRIIFFYSETSTANLRRTQPPIQQVLRFLAGVKAAGE